MSSSDSCATYTGLADYIPHTANGDVIVTTRDRTAGLELCSNKPTIDINPLTESDAKILFFNKLQSGQAVNDDALTSLLEYLEYLPLAITQAIAFILVMKSQSSVTSSS